MSRLPLIAIGVLGLIVGGAIGAVALSGDTTTETATQVVTRIETNTRTVGRGKAKTKTVVRTRTVTTPASGSSGPPGESGSSGPVRRIKGTQTFSGKGFKRLGTIKVAKNSLMQWTNTGRVFSVISQFALHVSSTKKKGTAKLFRGTYPDFRVAAIGNWTLKIVPR
jgi:hypothetical protein